MKRNDAKPDLHMAKEIAWAQRHGAFNDPLGRALLFQWQLGQRDEQYLQMLRERVRKLRSREVFGHLDPFQLPQLRNGQLRPGNDRSGKPIQLRLQDLTANLLIAGNTGSTKTTFLIVLVIQLLAMGVRVWLADMYKRQLHIAGSVNLADG